MTVDQAADDAAKKVKDLHGGGSSEPRIATNATGGARAAGPFRSPEEACHRDHGDTARPTLARDSAAPSAPGLLQRIWTTAPTISTCCRRSW